MRFKGTLWLVVALIALIAYYYGVELPSQERKKSEEARSEQLFQFDAADISEFALQSAAQNLRLKRKNADTWQLIEPLKAAADNENANAFAAKLSGARFTRVVEEVPEDPASYGLKDPGLTVRLKLKDGKEHTLAIGDVNPLNQKVYVQRGGETRVLLAADAREDFEQSVFALRDKSLLKFDARDIDTVRLKNADNDFTLVKKGERWTVSHKDLKSRGDTIEIDNFLHTLENARVKEFVEEAPKSLAPFGLNAPAATLKLHSKKSGKPLTLLAGEKRDTSGYFGKVESAPNVVLLGNQMFKILSRQFDEFMDRSLLEFKEENVTQLDIQNGQETIRLARSGAKDWKITEPQSLRVDPAAVKSVLIDLKQARISEFIKTVDKSPALFGLDFPPKILTVHRRNKNPWTMKLGNDSINRENVYATRSEDGTVFTLGKDTVKKLFRSLHDLRFKKLLQFDKKDIDRIAIAYPDRTFELKAKGKEWALKKPETIDAVPEFLGKDILWTLTNLEFESIVEEPLTDKQSGLDKPSVTVSIWKGNENLAGRVSVGNPTENDEKRRYARVSGKPGLFTIKDRFLDEIPKDLEKFKSG